MSRHDVAVLGTGMTDMSRRDLDPDTMAYEVVHEALGDAGVSADELGLVIVGNAMAGRLSLSGIPFKRYDAIDTWQGYATSTVLFGQAASSRSSFAVNCD